jgi:prepilin-type N-terminal cleavage/methylation domain-containing protein
VIRLVQARWQAVASWRSTDGFSLMEVVVALGIILVVMTFSLAFFIRSMQGTALQQQRQAAVAVADQAMELTRSVPASTLLAGRDGSRVDAQWASPGSVVTSQSVKQSDPAATSTSMPLVPFGTTSLVNNVSYPVRTFVDGCYLDSTSVCGPTNVPKSHLMYRVTVEVRWQPKADQSCSGAGGACAYVVSTLRDPSPDVPFIQTGP